MIGLLIVEAPLVGVLLYLILTRPRPRLLTNAQINQMISDIAHGVKK